jgi:hypothetical protein
VREQLHRLEADGRTQVFSTAGVKADVDTDAGPCEQCGGPTGVQKTHDHRVVTLEHGPFVAHETTRVCRARCRRASGQLVTRRSEALARKVPPGGVYGYDIEVRVGLQRFVRYQQREEIRAELEQRYGISLSGGQISELGHRFLVHLEVLHRHRAPALRDALAQDGGYPMHIDATGEDGRGTLFVAYAGWLRWVLGSWKISTERAELILPRLRQTVAAFGRPVAIVRDLGKAATGAARDLVDAWDPPTPVLSCHFHLVKDVGEDLLETAYGQLRDLFRRFGLRAALRKLARDLGRRLGDQLPERRADVGRWTEEQAEHTLPEGPQGLATVRALAQWALDYRADGRHGFPFDLPYLYLYQRCYTVRRAADAYLRRPPTDSTVHQTLQQLARALDPVVAEVPFAQVARTLTTRAAILDELRTALRLHPDTNVPTAVPQSEQAAAELGDIRAALDSLVESLKERRPERGPAQDTREAIDIVLDHLARHGDSLWGHAVHLTAKAGGGIRLVERTNLLLEGFWHQMKHGERRRSGRKVLTYDFENLPAAAALARNLERPDYVAILCGSLAQLPQAFAELDQAQHRRSLAVTPSSELTIPKAHPSVTAEADANHEADDVVSASFPREDRQLIRAKTLRARIEAAAHSRAPRCIPARHCSPPDRGSANRVLTL